MGKDSRFGVMAADTIPDRWVQTVCGYCSVGCGMYVGVKKGEAVAVKGDPKYPVNEGKLCPKGLSEHHTLRAPSRARAPILRGADGKPHPIGWDDALDLFLGRVRSLQSRYGSAAFAVLSTGQLVTEEFYALGKLVRLGMRVPDFDGNTTLCMASAVAGYKRSFGSDGPPGSYLDFETSDVILLVGANIYDNHPILTHRLAKNPKKTVIVVDPRASKTALLADLHLPIRPRSDLALFNGLAYILLREGWIDRRYVSEHVDGFDALREHLAAYPPERVSEITGLTPELIMRVARLYAEAKRPLIAWTMGVNHSDQGTETVNAINNLALLTGNVGKEGASPFSITGQCNAMGTREAGFTSSLPGYRAYDDPVSRNELARLWGIGPEELPAARGRAYPDIINAVIDGRVKGLWIIGTNPIASFPNLANTEDALSRLEFLVVQDGFYPTPTAERAHLFLPAAIWGEKEGTFTNSERRVGRVRAAVPPVAGCRTDFDIILDLARRAGWADRLFPGWTTPEDAFNEWARVSRGRLCDYSGMNYGRLDREGSIQWPCPDHDRPGDERLYSSGEFPTATGRAKLWCVDWAELPEEPRPEFPFILNTGRTVEHWHTRTKTREVEILETLSPEAWVEVNPRDAARLRIRDRQRITLRSQRGSVSGIPARITETVAPGQVFVPFHFFETNANALTLNTFDPLSREPNYKQCAVRIEPV
ncbi:MAG: molybdopterin-dependent oxidoreductase [Nitrospirae bacterium]|nr:molybdopterin-dependent oxidoreductase [Nitrospirota bacterium]